jgi:HK97 family phage major capsid protein
MQDIRAEIDGLQEAAEENSRHLAALRVGGGDVPTATATGGRLSRSPHAQAFDRIFRYGEGAPSSVNQLAINAGMQTDSLPDGGFLVPEEVETQVGRVLLNLSPLRRLCRVIPIRGGVFKKTIVVDGPASGWVGETEARPQTSGFTLDELTWTPMEIYANPFVSQQMLNDSRVDMGELIVNEITGTFATQESIAFVTGDGVKKPRGFLSYPVSTAADATRPFATIQYIKSGAAADFPATSPTFSPIDPFVDMLFSLKAPFRQTSTWLFNSLTAARVMKFKDNFGEPAWQPSRQEGQPDRFLGRPVELDENMPSIAANAFPVALASWADAYWIVDRQGIAVLRDPFSQKPMVQMYTTKRVAGALYDSNAIKLLKIEA